MEKRVMATIPYMPLYIGDYLADAAHLTTLEHGAYLLLIMNYWQRGKPLPSQCERLANVVRMSCEEFEKIKQNLQEFFSVEDGFWVHKRIEVELAHFRSKSEKAKASAMRRHSGRNANALQTHNETYSNEERTQCYTDTDTDTDKDIINTPNGVVDLSQTSGPPQPQPELEKFSEVAERGDVADAETPGSEVSLQAMREKTVKTEMQPRCPVEKIIALYHEHLPSSPQVLKLNDRREKYLRARWREYPDLEFWRRFFSNVARSKFLTGQTHSRDRRPFFASFEWLINPANFLNVLEQKYHG